MTTKPGDVKNIEASVRARLANVAKTQNADFGFILRLYFLERFLYRLGTSRYRENFLLKGALLFFARAEEASRPYQRPTRDIDLEALSMEPEFDALKRVFQVISKIASPEDGVRFDPDSISIETIREDDRYGGIRLHIEAYLGKVRDRIQIDIGFGDAVTPAPVAIHYPTLLDTVPAPDIGAYPIESVIAEKWEATVSLGEANTRLKDAIDIDHLARTESFDGALIADAIRRTFERRRTPVDLNATVLSSAYRDDRERQALWAAARKRFKRSEGSENFADAIAMVLKFLEPPYRAVAEGRKFTGRWDPAGQRWR